MKTLKTFTALCVLTTALFLISGFKPAYKPSALKETAFINPPNKNFRIIAFNKSYEDTWDEKSTIEYNISNYNELNFNTIQNFMDNTGSSRYGYLGSLKDTQQIENFNDLMDEVNTGGFKGLYSTIHTIVLTFAQRLVYEVNPNNNTHNVNYGFCYQNCEGVTTDQGRTVVHASTSGSTTPRYIARNIYENLQHGDIIGWGQNDQGDWFIKPMMRIDSSLVDSDPGKLIVKIKVFNYAGDSIKSIDIRARNFAFFDVGSGTYIYNGSYIDKFDFTLDPTQNLTVNGGFPNESGKLNYEQDDEWYEWASECQTSFDVWWYGQADVWFDKMTVDDQLAEQLFNGDYDNHIKQEADEFTGHSSNSAFYTDEMSWSNIPCIKYVQDVMTGTGGNPNAQLHTALSTYHHVRGMKDNTLLHRGLLEMYNTEGIKSVTIDAHEIGNAKLPPKFDDNNLPGYETYWYSDDADDYNESIQNKLFGDKNAISIESASENQYVPTKWGSLIYQVNVARVQRDAYASSIPMYIQPQLHSVLFRKESNGLYDGWLREPTNAELEAQAMVCIAHGAEGIGWFLFQSYEYDVTTSEGFLNKYFTSEPGTAYTHGLLNTNYTKRTSNSYGEDKWNYTASLQNKLKNWKPTLDAITWQSGYSVHSEGADYEYINDIKSIDPGRNGWNASCYEDGFEWADCNDERYWEIGFFNVTGTPDKYLLMVNRRCISDTGISAENRVLKILFDAAGLPTYTTWKITEVGGSSISGGITFNKNAGTYVDLGSTNGGMGWFKPGEGKLFKLSPVMRTGGTLLANEVISGQSFICEDTVLNDGYNITFSGTGNTVQFSDSATIIMTSGTFKTSDSVTQSSNKNTFKAAVSGHTWGGLRFNTANVKMYNSKFENISSPSVNYAVKMLNCPFGDIRNNIFTLNTDTAGAVQSVYLNTSLETFLGFFANYNTVTMNNSRGTGICVQGFSGLTIPIYAMNNTMTSSGYATGIMLSTVTGGGVKKNSITGFSTGINTLSTTADIFNNTISNTSGVSKGITALSNSIVNLAPVSGLWLGGFNTVTNSYGTSINIEVDNSMYTMDGGMNTFNISGTADPDAQHLYGTFPEEDSYPLDQRLNCFQLSGTDISDPDTPNEDITAGEPLVFDYTDYLCDGSLPSNTTVVDLGYGLYDTIPQNSGLGGGRGSYTLTANQMYDSVRISIAKHNYSNAKALCENLIEAYPESWQAVASLQSLFLSVTATDTTSSGITALKNLYEELILDHGSNAALVNIANYMVQKCKVLLHQYSSALSGFQSIINANQYTYLGLLARWDYMATSLLAPGGGGEGIDDGFKVDFDDDSQEQTTYGPDDDKSPFTKEQKQNIRTSIKTALENTAIINNDKVKRLEERTEKGDKKAERELRHARTLKSVIKTEKPKDTFEHIRIVNSDAQKVFGSSEPISDSKGSNMPTVFRLGQNYPNPFNPATKIAFDLPNDSKVNLVIYDILGREVKRIVNNEIRTAGTYIVDFNASVYASGVYFYRIEAEELNGSKHVDSKKMVLVK